MRLLALLLLALACPHTTAQPVKGIDKDVVVDVTEWLQLSASSPALFAAQARFRVDLEENSVFVGDSAVVQETATMTIPAAITLHSVDSGDIINSTVLPLDVVVVVTTQAARVDVSIVIQAVNGFTVVHIQAIKIAIFVDEQGQEVLRDVKAVSDKSDTTMTTADDDAPSTTATTQSSAVTTENPEPISSHSTSDHPTLPELPDERQSPPSGLSGHHCHLRRWWNKLPLFARASIATVGVFMIILALCAVVRCCRKSKQSRDITKKVKFAEDVQFIYMSLPTHDDESSKLV